VGSARFGGNGSMDTLLFNNPSGDKKAIAQEAGMHKKSVPQQMAIYRGRNGSNDIEVSTETDSFWISRDYLKWEDSKVSFGINDGTAETRFGRSHNYFYANNKNGDGFIIRKFNLRGGEAKVYGNTKYIERGRVWQH
jgi:hypothetical protein